MQECFLAKGGWVDQLSLEHKVFLHFFITFDKVKLPRYIFHRMLWALKESHDNNKTFTPYGRLLSDVFHQGGILLALKLSKAVNDDQLGTVVGKYINGSTLKNMYLVKEFVRMDTDLKESSILSNLMDDFPPICKQDPPKVRVAYVYDHWKATSEIIKYSDIPYTMYDGSLAIASKRRKSKKKATSEAVEEEASEPKPKKAKKEKDTTQVQELGSAIPTIQEEAAELEPAKILNKRTRGGTSTASSASIPPQPTIHKKKRKHSIRKMKVSTYVMEEDAQIEAAIDLVTREVRKKKAVDAALLQALKISEEIDVLIDHLLKESIVEVAQKVVELTGNLQELVVADELLGVAEESQREDVACLGTGTSEAAKGNTDSHNTSNNVIEIESSSTSISTSTSTFSDNIDDVPLNKVYENLHKSLAPSPSTKHQKKPVDDVFELMYPTVLERIRELAQRRIDVCQKLPANHPLQPPFI